MPRGKSFSDRATRVRLLGDKLIIETLHVGNKNQPIKDQYDATSLKLRRPSMSLLLPLYDLVILKGLYTVFGISPPPPLAQFLNRGLHTLSLPETAKPEVATICKSLCFFL
ncbi:hypothetical protein YC2023_010339 [Brassica napus]